MRHSAFWTRDQWWVLIALGIGMLGCTCFAHAQRGVGTLEITQPRPVLKAVEKLTALYGHVITYEEPRIVYSGDMKDVTQQRRARGKVMPRRVFELAGGSVALSLPSATQVSDQTLDDLLQQLVQSWDDSNQGGAHFQVEEDGAVFHIVPTEVRDKNGNWQRVTSILDAPISLPAESRTDSDTFKAIASAVGANAGLRVYSVVNGGVMLGGELGTKQYKMGAQNEPAASVLMRAYKLMGMQRTWFLLYDATMGAYVLNIDDVQSSPTGAASAPKGAKLPAPPTKRPSSNCGPADAVCPPPS